MQYVLGLDIGTESAGWAVIENDATGEPIKLVRLGVRIFDKAEGTNGASLAAPRRAARGMRRTLRRRRHRKERIRLLLEEAGLMSRAEQAQLFAHSGFETSVYQLRVEALARPLSHEEAVRLLIHFAQRRGYQSNSKSEEAKSNNSKRKDKKSKEDNKEVDSGKVKAAILANQQRMAAGGYRTVGELLWNDPAFRQVQPDGSALLVIHNHEGSYQLSVTRDMVRAEIQLIFSTQRALGADWASEALEEAYLAIWGSQRNFDEGPGGNSPYSGAQIEKMLGYCTFEPEERRMPKACYTAEYFRLLQTVTNLKTIVYGQSPASLTAEQRQAIVKLALSTPDMTYGDVRAALKLPAGVLFNSLRYGEKPLKATENTSLKVMPFYHKLRSALGEANVAALSIDQLDEIGRILALYKSDSNRRLQLTALNLPPEVVDRLLPLSTSGAAHLSQKAMRKLLPWMEQDMTYAEACQEVYKGHDGRPRDIQRSTRLHLEDAGEISNPVVRRAVSQTIKVINAIVRTYGPPEVVRVELARELGKSQDVRNEITKAQTENQKRNENAFKRVQELTHNTPWGLDIVKYKLFEEQDGRCLYSLKPLEVERLFDDGYVEVDRIVPYSISFDDRYSNKVLVLTEENRNKGSRLPYEYFGNDPVRWAKFETFVQSQIHNAQKKKNLLLQQLTLDALRERRERSLVDTQYLSRVVFRLIDDHLLFAETGNYPQKTHTVAGAITAEIRKRLGIEKIRSDGDLHHARDAAVIACVSPGMVQKLTRHAQGRETLRAVNGRYRDPETRNWLTREEFDDKYSPRFPAPWPHFRAELEARLADDPRAELDKLRLATYDSDEVPERVIVSRMPRHTLTGPAHEETIRSSREEGSTITKVALTDLKLNKDGEISFDNGTYYSPESDRLLYDALKARLEAYGGDGKKAFAQPFYKPKADGTPGPLVKKVKIIQKTTKSTPVRGGVANNGYMVRLDVFHVAGDGYYYVPIYRPDMLKPELPRRAAVAFKSYAEWKEMSDKDFLFSLYPGDLVHIVSRKPIKLKQQDGGSGEPTIDRNDELFYYKGFGIATAALFITTHDRRYYKESLGGKRLDLIEKCEVDVLGTVRKVRLPEQRQGFGK